MNKPTLAQWLEENPLDSIRTWDFNTCIACIRISDTTLQDHFCSHDMTAQEARDAVIERLCTLNNHQMFELPYKPRNRGKQGPYKTLGRTLIVDTINIMQSNTNRLFPTVPAPEPMVYGSSQTLKKGLQEHLDYAQQQLQYQQQRQQQYHQQIQYQQQYLQQIQYQQQYLQQQYLQ